MLALAGSPHYSSFALRQLTSCDLESQTSATYVCVSVLVSYRQRTTLVNLKSLITRLSPKVDEHAAVLSIDVRDQSDPPREHRLGQVLVCRLSD